MLSRALLIFAVTVGSILEMFFFRYNLISVYKNDLFKKLLRFQVLLYRFLIIIHPIVAITTINYSIGVEAKATMELWLVSASTKY